MKNSEWVLNYMLVAYLHFLLFYAFFLKIRWPKGARGHGTVTPSPRLHPWVHGYLETGLSHLIKVMQYLETNIIRRLQ